MGPPGSRGKFAATRPGAGQCSGPGFPAAQMWAQAQDPGKVSLLQPPCQQRCARAPRIPHPQSSHAPPLPTTPGTKAPSSSCSIALLMRQGCKGERVARGTGQHSGRQPLCPWGSGTRECSSSLGLLAHAAQLRAVRATSAGRVLGVLSGWKPAPGSGRVGLVAAAWGQPGRQQLAFSMTWSCLSPGWSLAAQDLLEAGAVHGLSPRASAGFKGPCCTRRQDRGLWPQPGRQAHGTGAAWALTPELANKPCGPWCPVLPREKWPGVLP